MRTASYLPSLLTVSCLLGLLLPNLRADDSDAENSILFKGAESGDVRLLQQALPGADPNSRNAERRTALMIAAAEGHFDAVRFLLWQGADANLKDPDGSTAVHYLTPGENGYGPLNLLIRCYAFAKREAKPSAEHVENPHLVLVNDNFIDFEHPELREHYYFNQAEKNGKPDVDDDGNGFVDDVYGWNSEDDEPVSLPFLSLLREEGNREFLKKLLKAREDFLRRLPPGEARSEFPNALAKSYENPIIRDFGVHTLLSHDFDLNDFAFAEMVYGASHGTHVAGIVLENSRGKALLHAMTHGARHSPKEHEWDDFDQITDLAKAAETYTDFLIAIRQRILEAASKKGRRCSAYLHQTGAGVVNMSYGKNRGYFMGVAAKLQEVYAASGKNPESMQQHACPIGVDLCSDLALELAVADAAEFALAMAENPDVLFVLSAGNEDSNNDGELPCPNYLSRFFPNAITVASVDGFDAISGFSNYGVRSVQIAAPGEEIESTLVGGNRGRMSGTSMAAPAVAGIAALIRAEFPHLNAKDVRRILERSARRVDGLEDWIDTGAIVDAEAALAVAAKWNSGREPFDESELGRLRRSGPDGPDFSEARHGDKPPILKTSDEFGPTSWRITSQAGFTGGWRLLMSQGSSFEKQAVIPPTEDPWESVQAFLDDNYEITSLAGDSGAWSVILSQTGGEARQQIALPFDQTLLKAAMDEGFGITSIAGWQSDWKVILTADSGMGNQRYTLPSPFGDDRKKWIEARYKEGYRITQIAGDEVGDGQPGSWMVVMSQNSGLGEQVHHGVGPWPDAWIEQQKAKGFRISSMAGYGENWVVVMSKGTDMGEQKVSDLLPSPLEWASEQWGD